MNDLKTPDGPQGEVTLERWEKAFTTHLVEGPDDNRAICTGEPYDGVPENYKGEVKLCPTCLFNAKKWGRGVNV